MLAAPGLQLQSILKPNLFALPALCGTLTLQVDLLQFLLSLYVLFSLPTFHFDLWRQGVSAPPDPVYSWTQSISAGFVTEHSGPARTAKNETNLGKQKFRILKSARLHSTVEDTSPLHHFIPAIPSPAPCPTVESAASPFSLRTIWWPSSAVLHDSQKASSQEVPVRSLGWDTR